MIVKVQPVEQWTGQTYEDKAVYLDVPDGVDVDAIAANNPDVFYYGENAELLIQKLKQLGGNIIDCPIKVIHV
jgi:gamma-glutamyltranspeptidase